MLPISAAQTVERCDRWAQDCINSRSSRSWWQRGVSSIAASFSSKTNGENDGSGSCQVAKEFQACPKYMEEIHLALTSPPAAAGVPTASMVDAATSRLRGSILGRWYRGLFRRNEDSGGESTSATRPVILRIVGGALTRTRSSMSAAAKRVLNFGGRATRGVRHAVSRATKTGRGSGNMVNNNARAGGKRGSGSGGGRAGAGADGPACCANKLRHLYPAFVHVADPHTKIAAAQRALRGPSRSAVPLAFGLNALVFVMMGLVFYTKRNRDFGPREVRRPGRGRLRGCPGRESEAAVPRARWNEDGIDGVGSRVSERRLKKKHVGVVPLGLTMVCSGCWKSSGFSGAGM